MELLKFVCCYILLVNEPLPPVHSAFYTSSNGGYNLHVEPRDTHYVADDTMDESQDQMNVQNLTYGFIIKLHSPNTNKTSYCPLVSTYNTMVIICSYRETL